MKKLVIKILLFTFPIIICLGLIEFFLRNIPNDYSYKADYLKNKASKIEVLYLGSSHIYFGVNPEYSQYKAFNAAMTSQDITLDWKLFNKYKWDNLKTIVIPIDYISLYSKLENGIEAWRMKNYVLYYDLKSRNITNNAEILNGRFSDNINRLNKYYIYKKYDIDCNELGFGTTYKHAIKKDIKNDAIKASERHSVDIKSKHSIQYYKENTEAIKNFISYAKEKKINILFVSTPVTKYYLNLTKNEQLYSTFSFLKKQIENNTNCHYFNLMNDPEFSEGYFYDADHLNDLGAKKFTIKIDNLIQKISN
ncbi:hypothetical protein [Chryseobacterium gallinarum]|uniref:DUF1574 domain-containing protein n=1 Tax=Chryseobacterium gallinarum TaxID=1324352 RepID=A0ABX6KVG2_CHRGL|nr:hypothetical protein [Chryseobacterium gallinarum]QIY92253.1 hypothetical protein FOB44_16980 [Chryseobacterium gallinarum]